METAYPNIEKFFRKLGCEERLITTSACFIGPVKCVFYFFFLSSFEHLNWNYMLDFFEFVATRALNQYDCRYFQASTIKK